MNENTINISNQKLAYFGAIIAVATALFYSLIVMIYVVIRSSLTIYEILLSEERTLILWQNGVSMAYSIAIFSILMALASSMVGMVTAIILKKSLIYFNPKFKKKNVILISGFIAVLTISIVYVLLRIMLKDWMTFGYIEPFIFWFLLPSLLFLIACVTGGGQLNKILSNNLYT